jgi:hypothetical protein
MNKPAENGSVFANNSGIIDYETAKLDIDHRLVLKSSLPLLKSRNSGVVLGVCTLHYYCGGIPLSSSSSSSLSPILQQIGKALVRISRNQREIQYIVLNVINHISRDHPKMFSSFLYDFFIKATDPIFNRLLKLDILTSICSKENVTIILKEFQIYIKDPNIEFVCKTIKAVGRIVDADPDVCENCMKGLMLLLLSHSKTPDSSSSIITACVIVLRQLLQTAATLPSKTKRSDDTRTGFSAVLQPSGSSSSSGSSISSAVLKQLIKLLLIEEAEKSKDNETEEGKGDEQKVKRKKQKAAADDDIEVQQRIIIDPVARANIIWLVGENHEELKKVSCDILRILAKGYIYEGIDAKLQILNLAVKISLQFPEEERTQYLMTYVLEMSRYDNDYDLRDRARFMTALLGLAPSNDDDEEGEGEDGEEGEGNGNKKSSTFSEEGLAELASHAKNIMLAPKLPPVTLFGSVDVAGMDSFIIGSLSSLVGHFANGYLALPLWPEVQPDSSVREPIQFAPPIGTISLGGSDKDELKKSMYDSSSDEEKSDPNKQVFKEKQSDDESTQSESEDDDDDDSDDDESESESDSSVDRKNKKPSAKEKMRAIQSVPQQKTSASGGNKNKKNKLIGSDSEESSNDDEDHDGDLLSALGKTSSRNSKKDHSSSASNVSTTGKTGWRKAQSSSHTLLIPSSSTVPSASSAMTNSNNDFEDAFGLLSFSSNAKHQTTSNPPSSLQSSGMLNDDLLDLLPGFTLTKEKPSVTSSPPVHQQSAPSPSSKSKKKSKKSGSNTSSVNLLGSYSEEGSPEPNTSNYLDLSPSVSSASLQQLQSLPIGNAGKYTSIDETPPPAPALSQNSAFNISNSFLPDYNQKDNDTLLSLHDMPNSTSNNNSLNSSNPLYGLGLASDKVSDIMNAFDKTTTPNTSTPPPATSTPSLSPPSSSSASAATNANNMLVSVSNNVLTHRPPVSPVSPGDKPLEEFTEPRPILNPAMGGGLSVSIAFRKGSRPVTYPAGGSCIFVVIKNMKDKFIRRVHVGFPSDVRKTNIQDIPMLAPGQEVYQPMEIVLTAFAGRLCPFFVFPFFDSCCCCTLGKQMKVDIRSDQGAYVGLFPVNEWDIMTPVEMSSNEFESVRERYRGLKECIKSFPLTSLNIEYTEDMELLLMNRIRKDLLMYLVQGAGVGELMFAASIRKDFVEEKILLTVLSNE